MSVKAFDSKKKGRLVVKKNTMIYRIAQSFQNDSTTDFSNAILE